MGDLLEDVAWYAPPTARSVAVHFALTRTFRPVATLRLCQQSSGWRRLAAKALHRWACNKAGMDLPNNLQAGPGLKFTHGWGVVLSPYAVLGRDVIVMHGATIGAVGERAPVIGDNVFIGAGAIVLGDIRIGDGATISAGSVVTKDVEPHEMVVGNPQRVIKRYERPPEKSYAPVRPRNSADI